jgi:hypothetical protein
MLSDLKNFNADRMDIPELVALSSFARALQAEFQSLGVEIPEWVDENSKSLAREIKSRNADRIASKLKAAKARLETLKTPDEKRTALAAEIAELEKQLTGA